MRHWALLFFVIFAGSAFAADLGCESALRDPFYRLVEKAVERQLLGVGHLNELATSERAYNPLANLPKENPALLKALDGQVKTMTPERWAQLRASFRDLATRTVDESSARAESREETAKILRPVVVEQTDFIRSVIHKTEWQKGADGALTLDVSMYGVLTTRERKLEATGIQLISRSAEPSEFPFKGEKHQVFAQDGDLFVVNLVGEERARLNAPGLLSRSLRVHSRWDQAYVFVLAEPNVMWRVYRFDGASLKFETSFFGPETIDLHPFITKRNELYFVDHHQDNFWYRDPQTGRYEKIHSGIMARKSHFWDEDRDDQATLMVENSMGDLMAIDFKKNKSDVRRIPVSVTAFQWEMVKFVGPDEKPYFVLAEEDDAIRIIDANGWRTVFSIPGSHVSGSLTVEVLPEGRVLMSTVQHVLNPRVLKIYSLWNAVEKGSP